MITSEGTKGQSVGRETRRQKGRYTMKQFTITTIHQCVFALGFRTRTIKVQGAVAAHRALQDVRGWVNPPLAVKVTCE